MRVILLAQSFYYISTGAWPLIHLPSFEAVAGPKTDDWLVRMVGLLAVTIGVTLLLAWRWRSLTREILVLATLSAVSFTAIDLIYAIPGRISRIYLADAAMEIVFIANGVRALRSRARVASRGRGSLQESDDLDMCGSREKIQNRNSLEGPSGGQ